MLQILNIKNYIWINWIRSKTCVFLIRFLDKYFSKNSLGIYDPIRYMYIENLI